MDQFDCEMYGNRFIIYHERTQFIGIIKFWSLIYFLATVKSWHYFIVKDWYTRNVFAIYRILFRLMFIFFLHLFLSESSKCSKTSLLPFCSFWKLLLFFFYLGIIYHYFDQAMKKVSRHPVQFNLQLSTPVQIPISARLEDVMWESHFRHS